MSDRNEQHVSVPKTHLLTGQEIDRPASRASAIVVTFCAFFARLWVAHGTFLNPDEALHIDLANQPSLLIAYRESLTASHPPLLTFVLYFWRMMGNAELWLRMPSIIAGTVFCWIFYKWMSKAVGETAGMVGLVFVSFLAPIVMLGAEIRQYAFLLVFAAAALYMLDQGFDRDSSLRVALSAAALYFAMLSHYSAFWFAGALGVYALFRISTERIRGAVLVSWIVGQFGGVALAIFLYQTHLAKLQAAGAGVLQGWMSDFFLRRSYYDPAHDHAIVFIVGKTFGIFQYFFGQLAVGDVMGVCFIAGVAILLRARGFHDRFRARGMGGLIVACFAIAWAAGLARLYPYSGTRHMAFLIIPAMAGVSVAIARMASQNFWRGLSLAALLTLGCLIFGKPRRPWISRANQSHAHIVAAVDFLTANADTSQLIFTDYQSGLNLAHYLCPQQPVSFDEPPGVFQEFPCHGKTVVSASFEHWDFQVGTFLQDWQELVRRYHLQSGSTVWVYQAGWNVDVAEQLRDRFPEFRDLKIRTFGNNVKIFAMTVGRQVPPVVACAYASQTRVRSGDIVRELIKPNARRMESSRITLPSLSATTPKLPE